MKDIVVFFLSLCVSGCSVQPLYTGGQPISSSPTIRMIPGRTGQILHAELCKLFKSFPHDLGRYIIRISLDRQQSLTAYDTHGIANRLNIQYIANVTLSDPVENKLILQKNVTVDQGSSISGSAGEIITSLYTDYEKTLIKVLAEKIFKMLVSKIQGLSNENGD